MNFVVSQGRTRLDIAADVCDRSSRHKALFFQAQREVGATVTAVRSHHPLRSSPFYRSSSKHAASGEGEPSVEVCESADAAASLNSGVWKHFWFPRVKNGEKLTDGLSSC